MTLVNLYYNPITKEHQDIECEHPESPLRIEAIISALKKSKVFYDLNIKLGHEATISELLLVHSPEYIKKLHDMNPQDIEKTYRDIFANLFTLAAAKLSVGMSLDAATDVLLGNCKHSVVLCRPPGHHAHYNEASGFCIFNNVVFAAKLLSAHQKVLIFDWDVHHGDGTEDLVEKLPNVKLITVQKYDDGDYYPGTGSTHNAGNVHSIGFGETINGPDYLKLFNDKVMPLVSAFNPTTILISAGFDTARGDPLGGCTLDPKDYKYMTQRLIQQCDNVIAFLEGGYYPKAVGTGVNAIIDAMISNQHVAMDEDY